MKNFGYGKFYYHRMNSVETMRGPHETAENKAKKVEFWFGKNQLNISDTEFDSTLRFEQKRKLFELFIFSRHFHYEHLPKNDLCWECPQFLIRFDLSTEIQFIFARLHFFFSWQDMCLFLSLCVFFYIK